MGVLKLDGTLIAGPPSGTTDVFPATVQSVPLALVQGSKSFQVATGVLVRNLASPLAFLALPELGANAAVTKATFLYLKCNAPMVVRRTTDDGGGGNVVATEPLQGPFICEYPDATFLKLLEVKGTGPIEYFLCGTQ